MLELLRLLVETVVKAIPATSSYRRTQNLQDLGADLYMLYAQLNEAMLCADDIVESIETYLRRMRGHIEFGNDQYALTAGSWIEFKVQVQRQNMAKIGTTMNRLSPQLNILHPGAVAGLAPLLRGKLNLLDSLLNVMSEGRLSLLEPPSAEVESSKANVRAKIAMSAVSTSEPWDTDVYQRLERYMAETRPRDRISEIRRLLEQIDQVLGENFTLSDILLRVGDERFRQKYDGEYFW